jgi:hypothetical protein
MTARCPEVIDLWRGLVRVASENCWMRETTTEGRFADYFLRRTLAPPLACSPI